MGKTFNHCCIACGQSPHDLPVGRGMETCWELGAEATNRGRRQARKDTLWAAFRVVVADRVETWGAHKSAAFCT